MSNLRDFLTETLSKLQNGVEQKIYTVDVSEDVTNVIQQLAVTLAEYFVSCWLSSPEYGNRNEVWEKWNTSSPPERIDMLNDLRSAFCDENGEVLDHPDPRLGRTQAKGNFAETVLRWIEETFREGEKRFIPAAPLPAAQGLIDLVEIIFHPGDDWFAILWESKATEDDISGVASDAYKQLDDYPNRIFYNLKERAEFLKEAGVDNGQYALALRAMPMLTKRRSPQIHYGLFITHDAAARQPYLRDLPNRPPNVPIGCHHLTFVALSNFADVRDAVWRKMELK